MASIDPQTAQLLLSGLSQLMGNQQQNTQMLQPPQLRGNQPFLASERIGQILSGAKK